MDKNFKEEHEENLRIHKYIPIRVLGKGAWGTVLLAEKDHKHGKISCAIKILKLEDPSTVGELAFFHAHVHSPFVVGCPCAFPDTNGKHVYLVMEYCDGGTLSEKLKSGVISGMEYMRIFICLVVGLRDLQDKNILHKDLYARNVFMNASGYAKIGDFGWSHMLNSPTELLHSPIEASVYNNLPEKNTGYGLPADVWALGNAADHMSFRAQNVPSEMVLLIDEMRHNDPKKRPTPHKILQTPVVQRYIDILGMRCFCHPSSSSSSSTSFSSSLSSGAGAGAGTCADPNTPEEERDKVGLIASVTGVSRRSAERAYLECKLDVDAAVDYLLAENSSDKSDSDGSGGYGGGREADAEDSEKIRLIAEVTGVPPPSAEQAFYAYGKNVDTAVNILLMVTGGKDDTGGSGSSSGSTSSSSSGGNSGGDGGGGTGVNTSTAHMTMTGGAGGGSEGKEGNNNDDEVNIQQIAAFANVSRSLAAEAYAALGKDVREAIFALLERLG